MHLQKLILIYITFPGSVAVYLILFILKLSALIVSHIIIKLLSQPNGLLMSPAQSEESTMASPYPHISLFKPWKNVLNLFM